MHLQAGMVSLTIMPHSHNNPVLQVDLKREMLRVVSCSKNSSASLAIRQIRPQTEKIDSATIPPVTLRCSAVE